MIVSEILALLKPQNARVTLSERSGCWGVFFSDGSTHLVGSTRPILEDALDDCLRQAREKAKPRRHSFADLIG